MNTGLDLSVLNSALQLIRPVAHECVPEALSEYESLAIEKCGPPSAAIMIYGVYSHGKSTLVNALLGEEAAAMDLPPTTSEIKEYLWEGGNCILIDTPGIAAKDEHTSITDAALKKCELVVFVVETGGVEAGLVWREIVRLTQLNQKVCLVINDFDNYMADPEKSERLKDTYRCNLQKAAAAVNFEENIVKRVPLLFVDAKLALRARLEARPDLLEVSGLVQVEEALTRMSASLDKNDILTTLRRNLLSLIAICKVNLALRSGNEILSAAEEQLAAITCERDRAFLAIEQEVENRIALKHAEINAIYQNQTSDQAALKQALSHIAENLVEEVSTLISQEITRASNRITDLCREYDTFRVRITPEVLNEEKMSEGSPTLGIAEQINWSELLSRIDWENSVKEGVVKILEQLKEWFPSLLFRKGPVTFGRWATLASKALGAAVAVGGVCYQIYSDYAAEQEAQRRAERKAQAIAEAVANTQLRLKDAFTAQIEKCFEGIFSPLLTPLTQQVETLRKNSKVDAFQESQLSQAENMLRPMI